MLLRILGVIALVVGTVQTSHNLSGVRGLPAEEASSAIVQVVEPVRDLGYWDPDMGM